MNGTQERNTSMIKADSSTNIATTNFEPYVPFENDNGQPPVFELSWLPESSFSQLAAELTAMVQIKPDIVALSILAFVAAMIMGRIKIELKEDFYYDLNLFMIIGAKAGERKSSAYRWLTRIVQHIEDSLQRHILLENATYEAMLVFLHDNQERFFLTSSDGGLLDTLVRMRDNKIDLLLKSFDGDPLSYRTKTSGSFDFGNPLGSNFLYL